MTDAGYEFARGIPLGVRTCDTCGEYLDDAYLSIDECFETLVPDGDTVEPTVRETHELKKFCSFDCAEDAVYDFIDQHCLSFEGDGPAIEPVTPCAKCGIPVLRLAEHSVLSLLWLEAGHHVVGAEHLAVLCPGCGGFYGDDDDPDGGEPVVPMPVLLAA